MGSKENFINNIQVSDDVAKRLLNVPLYIANDSKYLELYNDFVSHQKGPFKAIMYYFNDLLTELMAKGKISDFMEFRARIKAPESALKNDELNNIKLLTQNDDSKGKVLDDVFAMEFICATEEELEYILKQIKDKTITTRSKNHNKSNGYKAKHRVFSINNDTKQEIAEKFGIDQDYLPLFECQFKTIAVSVAANTGTAAHIDYKGIDPKAIQKKYDNNEFILGYNIPQMWVSKDGQMVKLSSDETLKKLYPFLNLTKKKAKDITD